MSAPEVLLGAVAYDPKVVTIWEGIRDHFRENGVAFDFALFSNYERQVQELLAGHVDVAWNTPLAHVRVRRATDGRSLALGMRDSDRDFRSRLVARKGSGVGGPGDLAGKTLAVGSRDSTQARILPLHFLRQAGAPLDRARVLAFDTDLGKHGDTGTSELDVLAALRDGRADAGVVGDLVWLAEQAGGRVDPRSVESVWTTPAFDHCMFDAMPTLPPATAEAFRRALFAMRWDDPRHRRLLQLEGLKAWMPPREEGYASLVAALDAQGGW
jgi:phosphonate transport system substrate-binding protein